MLNKREDAIIKILQVKDCTLSEIHQKLPKELQYSTKTWNVQLSKKLRKMIDDKLIQKIEENTHYPKYTTKKDPNIIAQLDGTAFKLNAGMQLFGHHEKVLTEIAKLKNKELTFDEHYTKSVIELLGIYLFVLLTSSYGVPMIIKGKQLQKARNKKKNEERAKEYEELRKNYLSKALSLEEGYFKTSSLLSDLIIQLYLLQDKSHKLEKDQITKKDTIGKQNFERTLGKMINAFDQLYPQTSGMMLNARLKSDKGIDYLKRKSVNDPRLSEDLLELLSRKSIS